MIKLRPLLDVASIVTVVVTFALFIAAAFAKGLTEELLLEAGVFLISVKLVLGTYKTHIELAAIRDELEALRSAGARRGESDTYKHERPSSDGNPASGK